MKIPLAWFKIIIFLYVVDVNVTSIAVSQQRIIIKGPYAIYTCYVIKYVEFGYHDLLYKLVFSKKRPLFTEDKLICINMTYYHT